MSTKPPLLLLTHDEIDFMIFRYLIEAGYEHTAYTLYNEGCIEKISFRYFGPDMIQRCGVLSLSPSATSAVTSSVTSNLMETFFPYSRHLDYAQSDSTCHSSMGALRGNMLQNANLEEKRNDRHRWMNTGVMKVALQPDHSAFVQGVTASPVHPATQNPSNTRRAVSHSSNASHGSSGPSRGGHSSHLTSSQPVGTNARPAKPLTYLENIQRIGIPYNYLTTMIKKALVYQWVSDHLVPHTTETEAQSGAGLRKCMSPYGLLSGHQCEQKNEQKEGDSLMTAGQLMTKGVKEGKGEEARGNIPTIELSRLEINLLIYQTLKERNHRHTNYVFTMETMLEQEAKLWYSTSTLVESTETDVNSLKLLTDSMPSSSLIQLIEKGMYQLHTEYHTTKSGLPIHCNAPFALFIPHNCSLEKHKLGD